MPATARPSTATLAASNPFLRPQPRQSEKPTKVDSRIILAGSLLLMTVCLPLLLFIVLRAGGNTAGSTGPVAATPTKGSGDGHVVLSGGMVSDPSSPPQAAGSAPAAGASPLTATAGSVPQLPMPGVNGAGGMPPAMPAGPLTGSAMTPPTNGPPPSPLPGSPELASTIAPSSGVATSQTDLVGLVEPSLVVVDIGRSMGSGFIYDELGTIVTNYHVIEGAKRATVRFADKSTAEVTGFLVIAPGKDLAVLRIDPSGRKLKPLPMVLERPKKAETVFAFGAPRGLESTVSNGIVSAVRLGTELRDNFKQMTGIDVYGDHLHYDLDACWIQTTAPISGGNSGGPLVNVRGEVVGLNTWNRTDGQNLNFAISIEHAKKIMDSTQSGVQPLSSLPKPRHDSPSHGASDKTLAYWNEIGKINRALFDRLKRTPRPHVPPANNRTPAIFTKLAVYYKKVADFLPETTHKLRSLEIAGVDADLVALATADALQLEATANDLRKLSIEAEVGTYAHVYDIDQIYKKSYGRFDFVNIGAAYEVLRLTLSARYQEQFPDIAGDARTPKPKAKAKVDDGEPTEVDDAEREKQATAKLKLAKQLKSAGKVDAARGRLESILEEFPGTKAAAEAEKLLEELDAE